MFIFLLVLFAAMRIVFLIKYWSLVTIGEIPFGEIIKGFWAALPLDVATASFMLAIPAIYIAGSGTCYTEPTDQAAKAGCA